MKTIEIDKNLINYKKDILFYMGNDNKVVFESIKNYINNEYLEVVYSTDITLSIKQMLLKEESNTIINYIIKNIKTTIENAFTKVISNCDVTITNKNKTKTLDIELTMKSDESIYNIDIKL